MVVNVQSDMSTKEGPSKCETGRFRASCPSLTSLNGIQHGRRVCAPARPSKLHPASDRSQSESQMCLRRLPGDLTNGRARKAPEILCELHDAPLASLLLL